MENNQLPVACFAPLLTDELLAKYKSMIAALVVGPVKDAMLSCLVCVEAWWELPESNLSHERRVTFQGGRTIDVVPLEKEHIESLDAVTPWSYELDAAETLFNTMSTGFGPEIPATTTSPAKNTIADQVAFDLHTAAFHLLWHAKEITRDREPMTMDKLKTA